MNDEEIGFLGHLLGDDAHSKTDKMQMVDAIVSGATFGLNDSEKQSKTWSTIRRLGGTEWLWSKWNRIEITPSYSTSKVHIHIDHHLNFALGWAGHTEDLVIDEGHWAWDTIMMIEQHTNIVNGNPFQVPCYEARDRPYCPVRFRKWVGE